MDALAIRAMKDATNGETLRGVVGTQGSEDIRMRKLNSGNALLSISEYIAYAKATQ